jgi:hypothetical protein
VHLANPYVLLFLGSHAPSTVITIKICKLKHVLKHAKDKKGSDKLISVTAAVPEELML